MNRCIASCLLPAALCSTAAARQVLEIAPVTGSSVGSYTSSPEVGFGNLVAVRVSGVTAGAWISILARIEIAPIPGREAEAAALLAAHGYLAPLDASGAAMSTTPGLADQISDTGEDNLANAESVQVSPGLLNKELQSIVGHVPSWTTDPFWVRRYGQPVLLGATELDWHRDSHYWNLPRRSPEYVYDVGLVQTTAEAWAPSGTPLEHPDAIELSHLATSLIGRQFLEAAPNANAQTNEFHRTIRLVADSLNRVGARLVLQAVMMRNPPPEPPAIATIEGFPGLPIVDTSGEPDFWITEPIGVSVVASVALGNGDIDEVITVPTYAGVPLATVGKPDSPMAFYLELAPGTSAPPTEMHAVFPTASGGIAFASAIATVEVPSIPNNGRWFIAKATVPADAVSGVCYVVSNEPSNCPAPPKVPAPLPGDEPSGFEDFDFDFQGGFLFIAVH